MSTENPFESPTKTGGRIPEADRERLRKIATAQRKANLSVILLYLFFVPLLTATFLGAVFALAAGAKQDNVIWVVAIITLPLLAGVIWSAASVYNLAAQLRGGIVAFICLLSLLVPVLGLILLLWMSSEATTILNRNGIKVGLLGANPNEI